MKSKWRKHIIFFLCAFILCGGIFWSAKQLWFNPHRGTVTAFHPSEELETVLTSQQAIEDLDYLVHRLAERHPACMNGLPDNVQLEYERECEGIDTLPEVSVLSLWQSAASVLSSLGDAHTAVGVNYENRARLPFSFVWKDDTLTCSSGEYDGYIVIEIGGVSTDDLYQRFLTQFSYELESWARHSFASRLNRCEYLSFVGVDTQKDIPLVLVLEKPNNGSRITATFSLREGIAAGEEKAEPNFNYSIDSSAGIGIFTLRQCIYDEEYKNGLRDFFTAVQENNIRSVIVDLRNNPGGNSLVANEFIRYLPAESYLAGASEVRFGSILWKNKPQNPKNQHLTPVFLGKVYVLTGADTFSSAMDFATLISDNKLGTLVGEVPGNMPSSYGDILYFQTPNAQLIFTVSYKYFIRPDASKSDSPLIPDVTVHAKDALIETIRLIRKGS
ncbi:MAG: S41 family peptidase [Oscillospiraceae bacterium]|nr:S41 family peptidase [Oscillospiraceae bacterium]